MMAESSDQCEKISTETCNSESEKSPTNAQKKLSHRKWKALLKKTKRKLQRQLGAQNRDYHIFEVEKQREQSPTFQEHLRQQEEQYECKEAQQERQRQLENVLWLERERLAQGQWAENKRRQEEMLKRKQEEEEMIKAEWEERQRKEKEEEGERQQKEKKKKDKQVTGTANKTIVCSSLPEILAADNCFDSMLKQARANERIQQKDGSWHNPLAPATPAQAVENCPFFIKTGCCRFGDRCSRSHPYPELSSTLLFSGMYAHFGLSQGLSDEFDTDIILEYEEGETYHHFREFYEDSLPEFKTVGKVIQFKVCCNYEPHLRGNVYVQYRREEDAGKAFMLFNGRWYGGRQLQCEYTVINRWKNALCGLFRSNRCPKGKNCNFLHTFRNPGGEFWEADRDFDMSEPRSERRSDRRDSDRSHRAWLDHRGRREQTWDFSRNHSRSRNPRSRRSRSRSPLRSHRRSTSPGRSKRSRSKSPKRYRSSKVRSPRRRKSRSRSPLRSRRSGPLSPEQSRRSRSHSPESRKSRPQMSRRSGSRSPSTQADSPSVDEKVGSAKLNMAWESSSDDSNEDAQTLKTVSQQSSPSDARRKKSKKLKKENHNSKYRENQDSRSRSDSRASQDESIVQKHRHKKNKKHKKQRQKDNKEKITNDANDVEDPKDSPVSVGASEASRMEITDPCNKANHSGFTPEHSLGHHEHFTNAKMNGNETP